MLTALALTASLAAIPPLAGFPSTVTPAGATLPVNGHVVAFGDRVLVSDDLGVIARVDGAIVAPVVDIVGCCAIDIAFDDDDLVEGADLAVTIAFDGVDTDVTWTIGAADVTPPTLTSAAVVQVVTTTTFAPPLSPHDGPGFIVTIDLEGVGDAVAVSSLQAFDDDGALVGVVPPSGVPADRIVVGLDTGGEQCVQIVVVDSAGNDSAVDVCADIAVDVATDDPAVPAAGDDSCAAAPAPLWLALAALLLGRKRAIAFVAVVVVVVVGGGCSEREPQGSALCGDDFDDHSTAITSITEEFFAEHARAQFGFVAMKVLVLGPDDDTPVVAVLDSDFFPLHDTWFSWRLVHGHRACGADEIAPLQPAQAFERWSDVVDWARTQDRLPPFLALVDDDGERLTAPDFYRLARNEEPRSYVPAYVRRDDNDNTWQWRVGSRTDLTPHHVEAIFAALDPLVPSTHTLVWGASAANAIQAATARAMQREAHPLSSRTRVP